jgi:hypothetical protein
MLTKEPLDETNCDDNSALRLLLLGLVVGAAYYLGALIGFALTFPGQSVSVCGRLIRDLNHCTVA